MIMICVECNFLENSDQTLGNHSEVSSYERASDLVLSGKL